LVLVSKGATRRWATLLGALAVLACTASSAAADDAASLRWSPRWTRFTTLQYTLTAGMAGAAFASDTWISAPERPNWQGNILFDGETRSWLSAGSESGRLRAARVSDVLVFGIVAYPFLVDTLLVATVLDHSYDVAWQMAMIGIQSVLISKLVTGLTKRFVGRARPDYARCEGGDELACGTTTESFISGHTSTAFVGAGLICANHQNLRLYGSELAGAITCGASLAVAATSGTLRIVSDRHHLSDVLAGAAVGLAAGYLLPNLMNYDFGASAIDPGGMLMPMVSERALGMEFAGQF
jgi:membrane-associated phospholipid phosphatase